MRLFAVLVVAAVKLIPEGTEQFTLQMHPRETIQFTKQADGGWKVVELPNDDFGVYYIDGMKLRTKAEGKEHTQDMSFALELPEKPDWKTLERFGLGGQAIKVERKERGINFVASIPGREGTRKRTYILKWRGNVK